MARTVLVCGGREFTNYELICRILDQINILRIVEGEQRGADLLAREYAVNNQIPFRAFPANWAKFGRAAGSIRNKQMLDEGLPNLVVAFPGGIGTANMIRQSRERSIEVIQVYTEARQVIL